MDGTVEARAGRVDMRTLDRWHEGGDDRWIGPASRRTKAVEK